MVPILPEPFLEKEDSTRRDSFPAAGTLNENIPLVNFQEVSLGLLGGAVSFLAPPASTAPAMLTQGWRAGWLPSSHQAKKVRQLQTTETWEAQGRVTRALFPASAHLPLPLSNPQAAGWAHNVLKKD